MFFLTSPTGSWDGWSMHVIIIIVILAIIISGILKWVYPTGVFQDLSRCKPLSFRPLYNKSGTRLVFRDKTTENSYVFNTLPQSVVVLRKTMPLGTNSVSTVRWELSPLLLVGSAPSHRQCSSITFIISLFFSWQFHKRMKSNQYHRTIFYMKNK